MAVMSMFGFRVLKEVNILEKYKKVAQKVGVMTWLDDAIAQKKFENMK